MEKILDDLELNIQSKEAILLNAASAIEKKAENQAEIEQLEEEVVELKKSIEKIKQVKQIFTTSLNMTLLFSHFFITVLRNSVRMKIMTKTAQKKQAMVVKW